MTALDNLVRLKLADAPAVCAMLGRAFYNDPLFIYFFPDPQKRRALNPLVIEYWVRHDLVYGEVYAISQRLEGAAAWIRSDKAERTPWRLRRSGASVVYRQLDKETREKIEIVHNVCCNMHEKYVSGPHWYLEFIGVEPEHKGKGYASRLMQPMLARIDAEGLPCYLETQNEKNLPLYQHFGFRVMEEGVIPGSKVKQFAVLRINPKH